MIAQESAASSIRPYMSITAQSRNRAGWKFYTSGTPHAATPLSKTSATLSAALKEFSTTAHGFGGPKGGMVSRVQSALKQLDATLSATMQHLNAQAAHIQQETKSAMMLLCIGCTVAGVIVGLFLGAIIGGWFHK